MNFTLRLHVCVGDKRERSKGTQNCIPRFGEGIKYPNHSFFLTATLKLRKAIPSFTYMIKFRCVYYGTQVLFNVYYFLTDEEQCFNAVFLSWPGTFPETLLTFSGK